MSQLNRIQFVVRVPNSVRRHYVSFEDVKVLLSRLPEQLWKRLKKVTLNDQFGSRRRLGYTTTRGRCEISLCALPHQIAIRGALPKGGSAGIYGASPRGQWPTLAVRRFMLYHVFLHELGHLQIVLPQSISHRRRFAGETKADDFAVSLRKQMWSRSFDHPDPVHNPPTQEETETLKGWHEGNLSYRRAYALIKSNRRAEAVSHLEQALSSYPDHAGALHELGYSHFLARRNDTAVRLLQRAIELDPALPLAATHLAKTLTAMQRKDEAEATFHQALMLEPNCSATICAYADSLSAWGEEERASRLYRKLLRQPWLRDLDIPYANYADHLLFRSSGEPQSLARRAATLLQTAIKCNPRRGKNQYLLAVACSRLPTRQVEVQAHLSEARALAADNPRLQATIARFETEWGSMGVRKPAGERDSAQH